MARIKLQFAEDSIIEFFAEYTKISRDFLKCGSLKEIKYEGEDFFKRVIYTNYATEILGIECVLFADLTMIQLFTVYKNKVFFKKLTKNHAFNFANDMFISEMNKHDFRKRYVNIQKDIERRSIKILEEMMASFKTKHGIDLMKKSKSIHKYLFCVECEKKNFPRYLMSHVLGISEDYVDELLGKKSKIKRNEGSN